MAQIPIAQNLTLKELYAIFSQGRLQKTSLRELKEKGWLEIIQLGTILGLDSDGDLVWIPQDSTGRAPVLEQNSSDIKTWVQDAGYLKQSGLGSGSTSTSDPTAISLKTHKLAIIETALVNGVKSDLTLLAAQTSYKGRVKVLGLWGDTTRAGFTANFQDEDNVQLKGCQSAIATPLTAGVVYTGLQNSYFEGTVATKALEVDLDAGVAGVADKITLFLETWFEV